jgi:hypothetical protein
LQGVLGAKAISAARRASRVARCALRVALELRDCQVRVAVVPIAAGSVPIAARTAKPGASRSDRRTRRRPPRAGTETGMRSR